MFENPALFSKRESFEGLVGSYPVDVHFHVDLGQTMLLLPVVNSRTIDSRVHGIQVKIGELFALKPEAEAFILELQVRKEGSPLLFKLTPVGFGSQVTIVIENSPSVFRLTRMLVFLVALYPFPLALDGEGFDSRSGF